MTEHSFHGIHTSPKRGKGVTHVFGTICHLGLGPLIPAARFCAAPEASLRSGTLADEVNYQLLRDGGHPHRLCRSAKLDREINYIEYEIRLVS